MENIMLNIRKENPNENLIQKPGIDSKGSSIRESFGSPSKKQGKKKKENAPALHCKCNRAIFKGYSVFSLV